MPSLFIVPIIKVISLSLVTAFVCYIALYVARFFAVAACLRTRAQARRCVHPRNSNLASAGSITTFAINGIPFSFTSD